MKRVLRSRIAPCESAHQHSLSVFACLLIFSIASVAPARSQQTTTPPRWDPRQAEKGFEKYEVERKRAKEKAIPLPRIANPELSSDTRPLFSLAAVTVNGASALPPEMIAEAYASYIGSTVSMADLTAITGKITELYRDAGYFLSRAIIPPQDIKGGSITIQVIEGRISDIVLKGKGANEFGIREVLDAVVLEAPARLKTLERKLLLVDSRPGVQIIDTAIEELGVATGDFRLIVQLETWHVYSALGLDNRGVSDVGPMQTYWASALNSALFPGDTLAGNVSTIPNDPRELVFGRLSYDVPIGTDGARLGATAGKGEVWPSGIQRAFNIRTESQGYELRGSIAPLRTQTSSIWLTASAGTSDVTERSNLGTIYSDHLRIVGLSADFHLKDKFDGWNYLTLVGRQGIPALGASSENDIQVSRRGASGEFSKFEYYYTRYQPLSDIWSLKLSVAGQVASAPLLYSQLFYLGGASFGRGYDSSSFGGDNGVAGSLELRFDQKLGNKLIKGYQIYGFVDQGAVWNYGNSFHNAVTPASAGGGLRFYFSDEFQASVEVAFPLDLRLTSEDKRGARVFFSLAKSFRL